MKEHQKGHEDVLRQGEWLAAIEEIQGTALAGASRDQILELVVRRARDLLRGDSSTLGVPTGDGSLIIRFADGDGSADMEGMRIPVENSFMGEVVAMGAAAVLDDVSCHGRLTDPVVRLELGPAVFVPLSADGDVFGALCVARHQGHPFFTEQEVVIAEAFAKEAATAILR